MIPITAAPPNVPRLARSKSLSYASPIHASPNRRCASLPPMSILPPTPPSNTIPIPNETPSRPTFHLAIDTSDNEDDTHNPSIIARECSRRFHALSELLSTELGYLLDLRTLVSVNITPSVTVFTINPALPGLSSSASRFKKRLALATTTCIPLKSIHPLLLTSSLYSRNQSAARLLPHTIPPSSQWEHMLNAFRREPPLGLRFTAFHSRESGKMYHTSSILRLGPRRHHQKCGGDPRVPREPCSPPPSSRLPFGHIHESEGMSR